MEAMYYRKLDDKKVQCELCPFNCVIDEGKRGNCRVRQNKNGKLYSLVYSRPCAVNVDPIEKKPLFHFLPGSLAYSIGSAGCNLHCKHCQNWEISQAETDEVMERKMTPEQVVENAIKSGCKSIAYTYTEPTIFYEFVLECAKLAHEKGIKNVLVTNGYINEKPLDELYSYIDGVNVDLKAFNPEKHFELTGAHVENVLETIKRAHSKGIWLELTNLIIPEHNDSTADIKEMCRWIVENIGKDVPVHFSRFFPMHKMQNLDATEERVLSHARETAIEAGIRYVYIGNMFIIDGENTICPKCGKTFIKRQSRVPERLEHICDFKIAGVWQ